MTPTPEQQHWKQEDSGILPSQFWKKGFLAQNFIPNQISLSLKVEHRHFQTREFSEFYFSRILFQWTTGERATPARE